MEVRARKLASGGEEALASAAELLTLAKAKPQEFRQAAGAWHHLLVRSLGSDNDLLVGNLCACTKILPWLEEALASTSNKSIT